MMPLKMGRDQFARVLAEENARLQERLGRAARGEAYWGNGPPPPGFRHNGLLGLLLR